MPPQSAYTAASCELGLQLQLHVLYQAAVQTSFFVRRAVRRPKDVRRAQCCLRPVTLRGLRCALLGTCLVVRLRYRVIHHWKEESALFTTVYHCIFGSSGETVPLALRQVPATAT